MTEANHFLIEEPIESEFSGISSCLDFPIIDYYDAFSYNRAKGTHLILRTIILLVYLPIMTNKNPHCPNSNVDIA